MGVKNKKLIVIIADSWQRDIFFDSLKKGLLPEIQKELIEGGRFFKNVVSVFPSVSLSSHASILTGVPPYVHRIPGHRWYDRKDKHCRNYIGPDCLNINEDISCDAKTFLEINGSSLSVQSTISRGAAKVVRVATLSTEKILKSAIKQIQKIKPYRCLIWLPKGDMLAHIYGPTSNRCRKEMREASRVLGQFMTDLRKNPSDYEYDLLLLSDHGQREVKFIYDFRKFFKKQNIPLSINPSKALTSGCNLFTNGDSAAFLYFADKTIHHEQRIALSRLLSMERGIALIFLPLSESLHCIISKDGMSRLTSSKRRVEKYEVIDGVDPLGILKIDIENEINYNELTTSICWEHPDVLVQYLSSYDSMRSPDMIVTASDDFHFSPAPRIGWRFGFHRGSHGASSRNEMLTFAIFKGSGSSQGLEEGPIRIWDIIGEIYSSTKGGAHNGSHIK